MASRPAGGAEGTPGGGGGKGAANAAGAMAAAARELRPVEIVGLYETRREAAEQELAAWRAEVRHSCRAWDCRGHGPAVHGFAHTWQSQFHLDPQNIYDIHGSYTVCSTGHRFTVLVWPQVRSLTEQLREAQNLIAVREASGAWRAPAEVEQLQVGAGGRAAQR